MQCFSETAVADTITIEIIASDCFAHWLEQQASFLKNWLKSIDIDFKRTTVLKLPNETGQFKQAVALVPDLSQLWDYAAIPGQLDVADYIIHEDNLSHEQLNHCVLAWGLGNYQFDRYLQQSSDKPRLIIDNNKYSEALHLLQSICLVRDLINTPTEDMGPEQLALAAENLAQKFNAKIKHTVGDELLKQNYPAIHAVGRASHRAPRLMDMTWGDASHPKLTLVGKGVCFDTGGLDLKAANFMRLMKKDMGGAANVLGLAHMMMAEQLPIRLRVLIPAVENAVSGEAYRPGDIIPTRKGLSVEIGNTDAEGRVVLSDALAEACAEKPQLIIDMATLTGAARVALGPEVPVFFTPSKEAAANLATHAEKTRELVWQLPLYSEYRDYLKSPIADINNNSSVPFGGAITAALFLQEFVSPEIPWVHFDVMAWNRANKPGRPEGGEASGLRTIFSYIKSLDWMAGNE